MGTLKPQKFSYSKINTYQSCGMKYKLQYEDGHYFFTDSLATLLGSLLHKCEENIAQELKAGRTPDYEKIKDDFQNMNIPKKNAFDTEGGLYGINILKERYKEEFYKPDDKGSSYYTRCLDYLTYGMYRLENYLKENPGFQIYDTEKFFSINLDGQILSGFIDRIIYDSVNDCYIVEDIKTKNKPFGDDELVTPLQFVIYVYGLSKNLDLPVEKFQCAYDLPFLDMKQPAGTKGFVNRGIKKIQKAFAGIADKEFIPDPSPLCHFCSFCYTNPDAPEEGKYLCPYCSQWTRDNKVFTIEHEWTGMENYKEIQKEHEASKRFKENLAKEFDFEF